MNRALLSDRWYRIRQLRPRLRSQVQLHRHEYRDVVWYVIEDRMGAKHHRFNFQAYRVIQLMDGERDLDAIWAALSTHLSDETPTQDEIMRLLATLHAADLVQMDVTPDVAELLERRGRQVRRKWMSRLGSPLGLRLPLLDPDALLQALVRQLRRLPGGAWVGLWLLVVLPALLLLPSHWHDLVAGHSDQWLAADNWLALALLFPFVKLAHELGHGLACKAFGGEVHEAGVMLLVFYPVPYVDASHAAAFTSKWQRALVGAAGMLAEFFIAALAFYLWLGLEPGTAKGVAYNVAVLASATTLFFNANPLLRFDGYYILSDLIEIPNLAARANRHWQHLTERYAFGLAGAEPSPGTAGERRWFLAYAPLSYVYRLFVAISIAGYVAQQFFVIGVVLALWTLGQGLVWPVIQGLKAVFTAPRYAARGVRAKAVLAGAAAALALGLLGVPLPYHTVATGVLSLPEEALLRAQSPGFVRAVLLPSGQPVQPGQAVLDLVDPTLTAKLGKQAARVEEYRARVDAVWGTSPSKALQQEQELARELATLHRLQDEAVDLTVRARRDGRLQLDAADDLPGRYLRKGERVGHLRTSEPPVVRLVVGQGEVDAVRLDTRAVEVRLAHDPGHALPARLLRNTPAAVRELPSAALGTRGGGPLATDPRDDKGLAALESQFEFELGLPAGVPQDHLGGKVLVRFEHTAEPLGWRAWRAVRRAFLSHFNA